MFLAVPHSPPRHSHLFTSRDKQAGLLLVSHRVNRQAASGKASPGPNIFLQPQFGRVASGIQMPVLHILSVTSDPALMAWPSLAPPTLYLQVALLPAPPGSQPPTPALRSKLLLLLLHLPPGKPILLG